MKFKELIAKGENKTLELKVQLPSSDGIAKTVVAFSNTSGGKIIIGVKKNLEIIGLDEINIFETKDKICSIIHDMIQPAVIPEIYTVNIDNKSLLVIDVMKGNLLPYFLKNKGKNTGTYIRIGATNRNADYQNIIELERHRTNISFDEEIDYDYDLSALDLSPLILKFSELGKTLDNDKLLNLKLIKADNSQLRPTKGLLVILGFYEHCSVKCSRFKGSSMDIFLDKKEYSNDIFKQLESAEKFILNHINVGAQITELQRKDVPEIPYEAIREALINALVHRDYTNFGRDVKIGVYDSFVNIVSPGSLPRNLTFEDLFNGRSEVRNHVVARVFKELGLIEQWGSGINRIVNSCKKAGLPTPEIKEKNDFFDIKLFRPKEVEEKLEDKITATNDYERLRMLTNDCERLRTITKDYERLAKEKRDILIYLLDNAIITRKEAAELVGFKNTKTYHILTEMIESNLLIKKGKGRSTHYILKLMNDN